MNLGHYRIGQGFEGSWDLEMTGLGGSCKRIELEVM